MIWSTLVAAAAAIAAPSAAPLLIDGSVAAVSLTLPDLAALPQASAVLTSHGVTQTCTGVWLIDVLARAGLPTGKAVRGPALTTTIVATAGDGYRAAFTLGELDRQLGNAKILVADHCSGKALADADGPLRLVASSERRGARSVRQLIRLTIVQP